MSTLPRPLARTALLALAVCLAATAARPQGMYYQEIEKDGRIHVFNLGSEYERWSKSGEIGRAITRLGYGPAGQTVVFDSEEAIDLYNFKHGKAEVVEKPPRPRMEVVWRDGKTRMTLGSQAYVEVSNRIQPRFTHEMPDDSVRLSGTESAGDGKPSFRIRRAKLKAEGWFYRPELEFEVQLNWPDASTAQPNRLLEDANLDWSLTRSRALRVRFGQFKAPYGRQQLTSSGAQQFVDRSIVDERYNPGRETGLALWGTLGGTRLDWRAMVSNGNGRSQSANDNGKLLYTARVQYQALGSTRMNQWASGALLAEGDLGDSANGALLAIGANVLRNDRRFSATSAVNDDLQWGADYSFKYRGFSSVAEYSRRRSTPYTGAAEGKEFTDQGFHIQAGYAFRTPKVSPGSRVELAGRYAWIDPTDLVTTANDRREVGGAVSYYHNKHNLKVQADFRQIEDEAAHSGQGTKARELRVQAQLVF